MQFLLLFILTISNFFSSQVFLPVTGDSATSSVQVAAGLPRLSEFKLTIANGNANQLVGIYVPNVAAMPIVQQPSGNAGYVSETDGVLTQFRMAADFGTIGLLAHNYLAGKNFNQIRINQVIVLVYGDGTTRYYKITESISYQSLSPNDPYSNMKNLVDSNTYTAENVFYATYGRGNQTLVLQTCIAVGNEDSWGRLFLIGQPVELKHTLLVESLNISIKNLNKAFAPSVVALN